jgi:hypothetical protein
MIFFVYTNSLGEIARIILIKSVLGVIKNNINFYFQNLL